MDQRINENLLQTKRYLMFWISSLFSNIGTWMQQVAQPWVILSLSHSAFLVGLDSFFMNAPSWIFTLPGGYLADKIDRKKLVIFCQLIQFLCVLFIFIFLILGKMKIWIILSSSFIIGMTDSLSMPAFQSIVPSLVDKNNVSKAVALNSIQFNLSRILGPALAGIMIASYGAVVCYGANLISFIPFFMSLYFIYPKNTFQHLVKGAIHSPRLLDFKIFLTNTNYQNPLLTVLVNGIFCNPLLIFCPVLIKDLFHSGVKELGWAMTSFGIGGILGGVLFSTLPQSIINKLSFANLTAAFLGIVVIAIAFNSNLIAFYVLLFAAGTLLTLTNTSSNTNLQNSITDLERGRIISLFQMALHVGISIGSLLTGLLSSSIGIKAIFILNGILALTFQLLILKSSNKHPNTQ